MRSVPRDQAANEGLYGYGASPTLFHDGAGRGMFLIALTVSLTAPEDRATRPSTATVRIQRPSKATTETWSKAPAQQKREMIVRGDDGSPVILRLFEHE